MHVLTRSQFIKWFDQWGLFCVVACLLFFIPVYPKLPLFDILPGYIVRVRLEDVFIAVAVLIWSIQIWRRRTSLHNPLSNWIGWYAVAGSAALISGMFIVGSIPLQPLHIGKSFLHYVRYLEYFSLFFLTVSAVRTTKQAQLLLQVLLTGLVVVGLYGIGQKYMYWPVYSTMNREFSKGIRLYLTDHARVQSTFGGHYDLAAYLVILLPIVLALALTRVSLISKLTCWSIFVLGVWLITVSASRTSFAAFALCSMLVVCLISLKERTTAQRIRYTATRAISIAFIILAIFWSFGDDIRERLLQTAAAYPIVYKPYLQVSKQTESLVAALKASIPKDVVPTNPPDNSISTAEMEALVSSDEQPTVVKPSEPSQPSDVYTIVPDLVQVATVSASGAAQVIIVAQPRTYSEAALKHGLSLAIRLDTLWPRALQAFYRDPLFGSGYATLTKESVYHFTEAESTDNNFLRTLGETGLFGFITFYGAVLASSHIAAQLAWSSLRKGTPSFAAVLSIGFIVSTIGLLLNAVYIDVFASSKVAFVYWSVAGLIIGLFQISTQAPESRSFQAAQKKRRA